VQRRLAYKFKADKNIPPKEVIQFAYRSWPSGSPTPTSVVSLLDLISRVLERQSNLPDAGPIILHCRLVFKLKSQIFIYIKREMSASVCVLAEKSCLFLLIFGKFMKNKVFFVFTINNEARSASRKQGRARAM
jgi:hypothetical protein